MRSLRVHRFLWPIFNRCQMGQMVQKRDVRCSRRVWRLAYQEAGKIWSLKRSKWAIKTAKRKWFRLICLRLIIILVPRRASCWTARHQLMNWMKMPATFSKPQITNSLNKLVRILMTSETTNQITIREQGFNKQRQPMSPQQLCEEAKDKTSAQLVISLFKLAKRRRFWNQ